MSFSENIRQSFWLTGVWHMHDSPAFGLSWSNAPARHKKLTVNALRDKNNYLKLCELRWQVAVVWECAIKRKNRLSEEALVDLLERRLRVTYKACEALVPTSGVPR